MRRLSAAPAARLLLLAVLSLCRCDDLPPPSSPDLGGAPGGDEIPLKVAQRCPGDPGCEDRGDGKLYVGVAAYDITPQVEPFTDTNKNGVWDPGEPFEDKNGNKVFDAYWLAGYDSGRLAYGVHDPVWARALALRKNRTTVVLVAVDTLGLFRDETRAVEQLLDPSLSISRLLLHGTHCHETADLVGGWGATFVNYGVNEYYQGQVRRGIAAAVTAAVKDLRPARVTFGAIPVEDGPQHDMTRYVSDTRDPVVIDNVLRTMQFTEVSAGGAARPIATLINWAHHPESAGSNNHLVSSDFVHYLRERVEQRGGGTVVYVSGALGGQIGPGRVVARAEDGTLIQDKGFPKAAAIGASVAGFALRAMADPNAVTVEGSQAELGFRTTVFNAQVDNVKFHWAAKLGVYRRPFCCYDQSRPPGEDNPPSIETAVTYLRLGPASILTNPGELLPELWLGGYDGGHAGTYPFVDRTKPNFPDVTRAPPPPYLIDIMDGDRRFRQTWGLTMDFVGYIVPRYNWAVSPSSPYLGEADGDHYEETNSIGPLAEPQIVGTMRQLVLDGRPNVPR